MCKQRNLLFSAKRNFKLLFNWRMMHTSQLEVWNYEIAHQGLILDNERKRLKEKGFNLIFLEEECQMQYYIKEYKKTHHIKILTALDSSVKWYFSVFLYSVHDDLVIGLCRGQIARYFLWFNIFYHCSLMLYFNWILE